MQQPLCVDIGRAVEHRHFTGFLVDHVAPQPLQKAVHPDDVAGLPRTRRIERAHRHLVQAQRVGAVALADVVGRDGILQALAHLAPLAGDRLPVVEVLAVAFDDLGCLDIDLALVLERRSEDVALVEQAVVRLLRRHVARGRTAPCARTGSTAGAARRARRRRRRDRRRRDARGRRALRAADPSSTARPRGRRSCLLVGRVEVAQFVPAAAGPLRHHVGVASVVLRAVAEIEFDVGPPLQPIERALRIGELVVGIERARREAVGLGQHQRQFAVGQAVRIAVEVVDDRERLAPVSLAAEQPVAQLVGDGCRRRGRLPRATRWSGAWPRRRW